MNQTAAHLERLVADVIDFAPTHRRSRYPHFKEYRVEHATDAFDKLLTATIAVSDTMGLPTREMVKVAWNSQSRDATPLSEIDPSIVGILAVRSILGTYKIQIDTEAAPHWKPWCERFGHLIAQ